MVDTRTEANILNQILTRRKHRTNLIVAHRYSTIRRADLIFVMDSGELVEAGDYDTLLKNGNEFARLYEKQLIAQELNLSL